MCLVILMLVSVSVWSCTTFMATDGTLVLFGDSEDAGLGHPLKNAPESAAAFFEPSTPDTFGRMHLVGCGRERCEAIKRE